MDHVTSDCHGFIYAPQIGSHIQNLYPGNAMVIYSFSTVHHDREIKVYCMTQLNGPKYY